MFLPRTSDLWPEPEMVRAFFMGGERCVDFVADDVARVGNFGWWCSRPCPVILKLFQDPFIHSGSGRAARWTLKQGQVDGVGMASKTPSVILNLFQDNKLPSPLILKQVQDDETANEPA